VELLDAYAQVLLKVGLGLKPGQKVLLQAPLEALELSRALVRTAYQEGSRLVVSFLNDSLATRLRYEFAPRDSFEETTAWLDQAVLQALRDEDYAFLRITGQDPEYLAGIDPQLIARAQQAQSRTEANQKLRQLISGFQINWLIAAAATPSWARRLFPELPSEEATQRLWQAIFRTTRADLPDPIGAWKEHIAALEARREHLNQRRYSALHFSGPGTELTVGLPAQHRWVAAQTKARNGALFTANIPTEEVFTAPQADGVEGYARSTRPLSLAGQLIEGLEVRFQKGEATEIKAQRGQEILEELLKTDPGARRLGEVALVAASNPVAREGLLFRNTLFDENAASHLAFGQAYPDTLSLEETSEEALKARGGNASRIHIDWMIGGPEVAVDGLLPDGRQEPLMRGGEWVI
jgi:aminopeptidase